MSFSTVGLFTAAEVEGFDLREPRSPEPAATNQSGMDKYAVL